MYDPLEARLVHRTRELIKRAQEAVAESRRLQEGGTPRVVMRYCSIGLLEWTYALRAQSQEERFASQEAQARAKEAIKTSRKAFPCSVQR